VLCFDINDTQRRKKYLVFEIPNTISKKYLEKYLNTQKLTCRPIIGILFKYQFLSIWHNTGCHLANSVTISELRVTLQGAATWRIQWHVIPEPRVTLHGAATWWIHCHDSRATCYIAACTPCSHLAKLMSWSCHIAGCKGV